MIIYVVGENEAVKREIEATLIACQADPPRVVDFSSASMAILAGELVILVLSGHQEAGLKALKLMSDTLGGISLRKAASKRVVAVGPPDAQLILQAMRNGVTDYLDQAKIQADLKQWFEDQKSTDNLMAHLREPGRIISVLPAGGGVGASTLAANLAVAMATPDHPVALVDLDLIGGALHAFFDLKPQYSVADLCAQADTLTIASLGKHMARHPDGVYLLGAPKRIVEAPQVTPQAIDRTLRMMRGFFPFTVLDLGLALSDTHLTCLGLSDQIIFVTRLDFTTQCTSLRVLEFLSECGIPSDRIKPVVSRFGRPREMHPNQASKLMGYPIYHSILEDPITTQVAQNLGQPFMSQKLNIKLTQQVAELTEKLKKSFSNQHPA